MWLAPIPIGRNSSLWRAVGRRALASAPQLWTAASTNAAAAANSPSSSPPAPLRVAVVGGGFAGLAVSWHLLQAARSTGRPVQLQLVDAVGLGAGGSGAAAGLLHPYTQRGKMLWHGLEAFQDAVHLVEAAEAAVEAAAAGAGAGAGAGASGPHGGLETAAGTIRQPFVWRHGMLRPARSAKQARDIASFLPADAAAAAATQAEAVTDAQALTALVAGLQPELLLPLEVEAVVPAPQPEAAAAAAAAAAGVRRVSGKQRRRDLKQQQLQQQQRQQAAPPGPPALGLMIRAGLTIHPASYMHALWLACQLAARQAGDTSAATLVTQPVTSLRELQAVHGPFDAVVVAAGAAGGSLAELALLKLPLELCQGYSLDMQPVPGSSSSSGSDVSSSASNGSSSGGLTSSGGSNGGISGGVSSIDVGTTGGSKGGFPAGSPSLLGSPYIAAHGSSSLVVGATKRYGLTPGEAFEQLSRPVVLDASEAEAAAAELLPAACQLWPPLNSWQVEVVRSGVRALPAGGSDGLIPYAGRLPLLDGGSSGSNTSGSSSGSGIQGSADASGSAAAAAGEATPEAAAAAAREAATEAATAAAPAALRQPALPPCWLIGGLGARGLVYHAWLGRLVAAALLDGSEAGLPAELLRWRKPPSDTAGQ